MDTRFFLVLGTQNTCPNFTWLELAKIIIVLPMWAIDNSVCTLTCFVASFYHYHMVKAT